MQGDHRRIESPSGIPEACGVFCRGDGPAYRERRARLGREEIEVADYAEDLGARREDR